MSLVCFLCLPLCESWTTVMTEQLISWHRRLVSPEELSQYIPVNSQKMGYWVEKRQILLTHHAKKVSVEVGTHSLKEQGKTYEITRRVTDGKDYRNLDHKVDTIKSNCDKQSCENPVHQPMEHPGLSSKDTLCKITQLSTSHTALRCHIMMPLRCFGITDNSTLIQKMRHYRYLWKS